MAQPSAVSASAAVARSSAEDDDLAQLTAAIDLAADCTLRHCCLAPTRAIYTDNESVTVVDLREAHEKGAAHAGSSSTMSLQLFPPPKPKADAAASERKQAEPASSAPSLVHSSVDLSRYSSEVDFVRSMMCELCEDPRVSYDLQSLHRLFNREWLHTFLTHQHTIAPRLFKSHANLRTLSRRSALLHLVKFSNASDVGTPVFAWHGTTAQAIPSIMQHGLSTRFSVRGGLNIWTSQQFEHSFTYCRAAPGEGSHVLLCLVLRTEKESSKRAFQRLPIPDSGRVLPIYHLVVKATVAAV